MPGQGEHRKTVTVLFCDLAGSTALGETLDPERLRTLLAGYFERMREIVERHGGSVEKFIGDAVMAVFGVPIAHEDDALRAVRAAVEMRDTLPELGLDGRIGVMTGEVVTGTDERLATGDPVNVAARLEQAASPGEVLIGQPTLTLVHDAVEAERVDPLALKGKAEPVAAYRVVRVGVPPERRHDATFVGRERELRTLRDALDRVDGERRCELVTVVGEAGVGKSRLVAEAFASADAKTVRGRCPPYGEGITYWPVVDVLKQIDTRPVDETATVAVGSLLRESGAQTSPEELAWAFRKTLEHDAAERALIVVFDDIQWGEVTFLDLIEHVALLSTGAPILLVCMARPELVERRPTWPVTLRLEPLPEGDVEELIPRELAEPLRRRIARAAAGNPLFIAEMLAISAGSEDDVAVPPTLQALLAARLDQLDPAERTVLESGAVEGEIFHRGAVQALGDRQAPVTPHLAALVRKQLIRPDRAQIAGEDGFRFRHLLLRDAAYDAVPKRARADLHERFATWLEQHGSALVEIDEILGHHLEQAYRFRVQLGSEDHHTAALAGRAGGLLAAAGRRAQQRGDDGATCALLGRATRLLREGDPDLPSLLALLGSSTYEAGDLAGSLEILRRAQDTAAAAGQRSIELRARMDELAVLRGTQVGDQSAAALEEVRAAIVELERLGDSESLARAWRAMIEIGFLRSDLSLVGEASSRLLECARRAGIRREEVWAMRGLAAAMTYGPVPVEEAILRLEHALGAFPREPAGEDHLALLYAYADRHDDAEQTMARSRRVRVELGQELDLAGLSLDNGWIAILAGRPERAEPELRAAVEVLERAGEEGYLSSVVAVLGEVLYQRGRYDEAAEWARRSRRTAGSEDVESQAMWRALQAKLLARHGEAERALSLSTEAIEWLGASDNLQLKGDCLSDRGEVLRLLGRPDEARPVLEEALAVYEQKGIVPLVDRTRDELAALASAAPR